MYHHWLRATDGTGSTVRTVLLDFRNAAFDLEDHQFLSAKPFSPRVQPTIINCMVDVLRNRQQRVKLNGIQSDWLDVPVGVLKGT